MQLLLGGLLTPSKNNVARALRKKRQTVAAIDLVTWIRESFRESDFILLKLDVEGAEHSIVPALAASPAGAMVDVLLWECHNGFRRGCKNLTNTLRESDVGRVFAEPKGGSIAKWRHRLNTPPLIPFRNTTGRRQEHG